MPRHDAFGQVKKIPACLRFLSTSFPTAQSNVNKLVAAGILREMTGRATNRIYVADEILKSLDAPTADVPG